MQNGDLHYAFDSALKAITNGGLHYGKVVDEYMKLCASERAGTVHMHEY